MAEKVSELRRIGISRVPDLRLPNSGESVRKRRERLNAIGEQMDDLPVDPELSYVTSLIPLCIDFYFLNNWITVLKTFQRGFVVF